MTFLNFALRYHKDIDHRVTYHLKDVCEMCRRRLNDFPWFGPFGTNDYKLSFRAGFWPVLSVISICQRINIQALTDCTDPFCTWRGTWRSEPMRTQQKHPKSLQWPTTLSSNRFMGPLFQFENNGVQPKNIDIHVLWLIHYLCKCTVSSLNMHSHCSRSFRQEQQLALAGCMTSVCSIFIFKLGNGFVS